MLLTWGWENKLDDFYNPNLFLSPSINIKIQSIFDGFPKMAHFPRVLDDRGRVIYGDNGIFMKWTEWFYSNDPSLTCCSRSWQAGRRRRGCWPMRGQGCWILTNQRPAGDHPDGPGHPSHSDHRPVVSQWARNEQYQNIKLSLQNSDVFWRLVNKF